VKIFSSVENETYFVQNYILCSYFCISEVVSL